MARGDGSITSRGKNKWLVQLCYDKDPITGKYKRASKVVRGTKTEACKVRDQMRKEREDGLVLDGSKLAFEDFSGKYIELIEAAGDVGRETIDRRASYLRRVCCYVGDMRLKDIAPQVVEATLAAIKRDKIAERGSFRNATLKNYFEDMKLVFQKALDYDFIM